MIDAATICLNPLFVSIYNTQKKIINENIGSHENFCMTDTYPPTIIIADISNNNFGLAEKKFKK